MRSAITVSLVPETKGGPFVFSNGLEDAFTQAHRLGFDGVEVFPPAADCPALGALPDLVQRYHLPVAAIGTGAGWVVQRLSLTHREPAERRRACDFVRTIIDVAAQFRAPAIIGSMQGRSETQATRAETLEWLGSALDELGEHAAGQNVPLLYEPLNRYETNVFNRLGDAADWLRTLRTRNVRILADLFHMNIDEVDLAAAVRAAGALLGHVHFADSNRHAVGFGHTSMPPVIAALRAMDYRGYLSAEVFPLPDPMAAAERTIASFRDLTGAGAIRR